ncbi:MAG TPA: O-methyltransferase, partial [Solirubrobacteraceae bacterium]|nr:O-methyltransferase [Solirubrobacteraceae bacterium]
VDGYFASLLAPEDEPLAAARDAVRAAALPVHEVSPLQGKLLHVLARAIGARRILEIGTLGGYSTIWLARALPDGGRVSTIEREPAAVDVARRSCAAAAVGDRVEVLEGDAREVLRALDGPFDLVFIDADKRSNPEYLAHALRLSRPGTLIVADNVVRGGAVADPQTDDPDAQGVREFAERLAADPRLVPTAIQTVGTKGYDGFVLALVTAT